MKTLIYLLAFPLVFSLVSSGLQVKDFEIFKGGRPMYSKNKLVLYSDSTFYYSEWNHTQSSIKDTGSWSKRGGNLFLNSVLKTKWVSREPNNDSFFYFRKQKFTINGDTLKLIAKRKEEIIYFNEYFTFHKVKHK